MFFTNNLHVGDLHKEMSKIFDHLNSQLIPLNKGKSLPVNIQGNQDEALITVEAPGINVDAIDIQVEGNVVHISITREEKDANYYIQERPTGNRKRSLRLGFDINEETVEASYKKGILSIHVQKQHKSAPKKITVKNV